MKRLPHRMLVTVGLLAALAMLTVSGCWNTSPTMAYADLLKQIEADNVSRMQISENWATVQLVEAPAELETDRTEHLVMLPISDPALADLSKLLDKHGVPYEFAEPR